MIVHFGFREHLNSVLERDKPCTRSRNSSTLAAEPIQSVESLTWTPENHLNDFPNSTEEMQNPHDPLEMFPLTTQSLFFKEIHPFRPLFSYLSLSHHHRRPLRLRPRPQQNNLPLAPQGTRFLEAPRVLERSGRKILGSQAHSTLRQARYPLGPGQGRRKSFGGSLAIELPRGTMAPQYRLRATLGGDRLSPAAPATILQSAFLVVGFRRRRCAPRRLVGQ